MRVTTTTTAIGGTGKATAGPPKEVKVRERQTKLRKVREKVLAPSVTNAGGVGISPEESRDTQGVNEARLEQKEGTRVTK